MSGTFYITTPIYYVNGTPHIGHAYTTIAADVAAEWQRTRGAEVFFLTGTDEHGQKVLQAAEARGMTPRAHCDDIVQRWKAMMARLGVRYDRFFRTTDEDHRSVVQAVLSKLHAEGEIYKAEYTGWYSVTAETFLTDKDVEDGHWKETGEKVQQITESNYFFRMANYRDRLVAHIEANPDFIRPQSRRNEVLGFLRKDLGDLCISRPKSRMSWGIELPFDADYVTYVWFDALLNYLTGVGYHPDGNDGYRKFWPASYQLLGKDILTTHSVYWTTMLMAMGLPLPEHLYAHGWWVSADGQKMSKSLGNVIDVDLLCDAFGVDATRYFLLREISFGADGSFTYEGFLSRYNVDLANDLGNLAHRGLSMTHKWLGGVVPPAPEPTEAEAALVELATNTADTFATQLDDLQFNRALEAVMDLVGAGNKYIDSTEPWALNRNGQTARLQTVKRTVLEICHLAAALMLPIMPTKMGELLTKLGSSTEHGTATVRALLQGGKPLNALTEGAALTIGDQLFPRHREMPAAIAALMDVAESAPEPKKTKKKKKNKKSSGPPPLGEPIGIEDFAKISLRTGQVLSAEPHPDADRLLVMKVDIGEAEPRQIVAGIRDRFTPEDVVGRQVVVVANLKPANLRGVESQGMLLAAGGKSVIDLVHVDASPGEVVR